MQSLVCSLLAVWNGALLRRCGRRPPLRIAVLLACAVALSGCAHRIEHGEDFYRLKPLADPYSRNAIVCVPTAVGNLAGAPGVPLWAATAPLRNEDLSAAVGTVFVAAPAFLGGAITGLPFIPLSYLGAEEPCRCPPFGIH